MILDIFVKQSKNPKIKIKAIIINQRKEEQKRCDLLPPISMWWDGPERCRHNNNAKRPYPKVVFYRSKYPAQDIRRRRKKREPLHAFTSSLRVGSTALFLRVHTGSRARLCSTACVGSDEATGVGWEYSIRLFTVTTMPTQNISAVTWNLISNNQC